ncbi:hypothetical protein ABZ837_14770 [Streptomyces sp. NPDC047197]|uniref:hypothetical protein n=1 Tax=Streptomyces sp. NPDC047197 TaxID=3155477 RepID=UPI003402C192
MAKPTDDLYVRYMRAYEQAVQHAFNCAACQADQECPEGAALHERFARLQDAYRARQSKKRP